MTGATRQRAQDTVVAQLADRGGGVIMTSNLMGGKFMYLGIAGMQSVFV